MKSTALRHGGVFGIVSDFRKAPPEFDRILVFIDSYDEWFFGFRRARRIIVPCLPKEGRGYRKSYWVAEPSKKNPPSIDTSAAAKDSHKAALNLREFARLDPSMAALYARELASGEMSELSVQRRIAQQLFKLLSRAQATDRGSRSKPL